MSSQPAVQLGHVGIFVKNFEEMLDFYTRVFGFILTDGVKPPNEGVAFLSGDPDHHHQLVLVGGRGERKDSVVQQISFRLPSLGAIRQLHAALQNEPVTEIRALTHGTSWSVYFHDPEGNRVEAFTETPWYVTQPFASPIDYSKPDDVIYAETLRLCETLAEFKPLQDWKQEVASHLLNKELAEKTTAGTY